MQRSFIVLSSDIARLCLVDSFPLHRLPYGVARVPVVHSASYCVALIWGPPSLDTIIISQIIL